MRNQWIVLALFVCLMSATVPALASDCCVANTSDCPMIQSGCVSKPNYNPFKHLCGIVRASTDLVDDALFAAQELTTINVR